jgi:hypothetical protein
MSRWILYTVMAIALCGCGVIDPNITRFALRLPERMFTMDTDQWQLSSSGAVFPDVPCGQDPTVCEAQVESLCGSDQCTAQCVAGSCQMIVQVTLWRMVDLYEENPELKTINEQPLVDVDIESVHYEVTENTMNIDTPALTLYMAPASVMDASDSAARAVGVIPPIGAGSAQDKTDVMVSPEHEQALEDFMRDYQTPFNLIVSADITVEAGDPVPMGRITADVGVDATAGI